MNRINDCLSKLKAEGKKALITFITAGDPSMKTTEELVLTMFENDVDIVEIGVPFSDPIAEGKNIQEASLRALASGKTNLNSIFELVKSLRKKTQKPLVLMMYVNTIFRYGTERFFKLCKENGVDGVIVPDLPYEERDEILPFARAEEILSISMVTPASHERINAIASQSEGFLYCVSPNVVSGESGDIPADFSKFIEEVNESCNIPAFVSFGVTSPEQIAQMKNYFDGVIIGSAVVDIIAEKRENSREAVAEFIRSLKSALDT